MMLRVALLLVVTVPFTSADEKKPAPPADASALKGNWEVAAGKFDGNDVPAGGRTLVFGDREFTAYVGDKKGRTLTFTLNPGATPREIDLDAGDKGKALGIYALDKDELKICYAEPGAERPKAFDSTAGSKVFLLTLKRTKR